MQILRVGLTCPRFGTWNGGCRVKRRPSLLAEVVGSRSSQQSAAAQPLQDISNHCNAAAAILDSIIPRCTAAPKR